MKKPVYNTIAPAYVPAPKSSIKGVTEKSSDLSKEEESKGLSVSNVFKNPGDTYMEALSAETDENLRAGLKTLFDSGFLMFTLNKELLLKHKNDAEKVAEVLTQGTLSENKSVRLF